MSSIARHVSASTIKSTNRRINQRARRRAVRRFTAVWSERVERHAIALTILCTVFGAGAFLAIGYAARLFQMGAF